MRKQQKQKLCLSNAYFWVLRVSLLDQSDGELLHVLFLPSWVKSNWILSYLFFAGLISYDQRSSVQFGLAHIIWAIWSCFLGFATFFWFKRILVICDTSLEMPLANTVSYYCKKNGLHKLTIPNLSSTRKQQKQKLCQSKAYFSGAFSGKYGSTTTVKKRLDYSL